METHGSTHIAVSLCATVLVITTLAATIGLQGRELPGGQMVIFFLTVVVFLLFGVICTVLLLVCAC